MYELLGGRNFVPDIVAWLDGDRPLLVLEDLSGATWPPPWNRAQIDSVLRVLGELATIQPPEGLPHLVDGERPDEGWNLVLSNPDEFLSLGLCSAGWLDRAGPILRAAAGSAPLAGIGLLHGDVRSDNLCMRDGTAVLFDWNLTTIGNPQVDIAFWLPSLALEKGAEAEDVLPDCPPELAAHVAGFFASQAGQPVIPHAPLVRHVQLQQLRTALPWAVRTLGLEDPLRP
jgi:Ser/Thr protein kinase RdoA (MazF antagonist)